MRLPERNKGNSMGDYAYIGKKMPRVDSRTKVMGKAKFTADLKLPGMLFADMVRSPYAHARIKSINKDAALALPGVHAVLTADDLKPLNLHWMPTLAGDVQAVLADDKVHFQMQEVAVVVADDRYIAADAVDLVQVEYEELPVLVEEFPLEVQEQTLPGRVENIHLRQYRYAEDGPRRDRQRFAGAR